MNKWEKQVQESLLNSEQEAIRELQKQYSAALKQINEKIRQFQADIDFIDEAIEAEADASKREILLSQKRSKIYQKQYQETMKSQVGSILDKMRGDNYSTIQGYLKESYEDSYVGTLYDIAQQGIPVITPINQASAMQAILTDSKISNGLYSALGVSVEGLKKTITQEISRGIASGMFYKDISRNIAEAASIKLSNAKRIVITEGNRIQNTASRDAANDARDHGADLVKIWDATLDGKTRESHRMVDGEIKELDEPFSNGLDRPGDPHGSAAEVINCRCKEIHKPRWDAESGFAKIDNVTGEIIEFKSPKDYQDFKKKYWSKENEEYMKFVSSMETKYKTTDFRKMLGSLTEREYDKYTFLENNNPLINVQDMLEDKNDGDKYIPSKPISKLFENISEDPVEMSKQVESILDNFTDTKSKWSGRTIIKKVEEMSGIAGRKEWSCDISLREDSGIKTAIHEHLHARSVSNYNSLLYSKWKKLEEGSVELFSQEISKDSGIGFKYSYRIETSYLKRINSILQYGDDYSFAKKLFEIQMPMRYNWLKDEADSLVSSGKLRKKTIEALYEALDYFKAVDRYG